ncbi:unnamed protein product [Penicillium olsonii]|uniref:Uncharacterized protein n=1 Tax=Penicillium olsonii TaxID=99116 RepID=A0A9W4HTY0_PENOL|nr:unnamed protein product [Penicillium olsonii]CAG8159395.1 unnamed protein product [Penicillium olsonii]
MILIEQERKIMSLALVNGLASSSVDQYLTEIDVQSKDLEEQQGDLSFGPFGVFNLTTGTAEIPSPDIDDPDFVIASSLGMLNDASLANAPMSELSTAEEMLGDLNSALQWTDIFNLDPAPMGMNVTPPIWGYETLPTAWSSPVGPEVSPGKSQYDLLSHDLASLQCASHESLMLSDATFLLRHFQEHVMTHVAWLPMSQKSPWIILNIPSAMITLDQLTYMKRHRRQVTKHASLANLYAILACASYHLAMNPEFASDKTNQHWEQLTGIAYADAKHHMSMSLEHEFQGPNKAKYKEQLMANLSLATFAIISENQRDTRCHLVNMEYLIRLRGLVKPQLSRRARLLHYMYTWIRILTESTLVIHNEIHHTAPCKSLWSRRLDMEEMSRLAQRNAAIPPFDQTRRLDDFLRITPAESDRDLNMNDPKDFNTNLGDIHLTDPRNDPEEQHSVFNGVSEAWLSLLSQTTRLANVMDQLSTGTSTMPPERQLALHRRSAYLENMVCSLTSKKLPAHGEPKTHMLRALNSALVIYFYRRVRRVDPCILQGHVSQIVRELHKWDEALARNDMIGPGTAWPAFMAGCEATDVEEREMLVQWLDNAGSQSGFAAYATARSIMEEVWEKRDACYENSDLLRGNPGQMFSWTDLSRQNLHWLVLC